MSGSSKQEAPLLAAGRKSQAEVLTMGFTDRYSGIPKHDQSTTDVTSAVWKRGFILKKSGKVEG